MLTHPSLCRRCNTLSLKRNLSTTAVPAPRLRRAMLYVPGSNPRMLEKSFASPADSICYDLEDAVAPGKKVEARRMVCDLLDGERKAGGEIMARVNAIGTEFVEGDVDDILRTRNIQAIALPKTTTSDHIEWLVSRIERLSPPHKLRGKEEGIKIIAMIENAKGMINIEDIAKAGEGYLDGLLFAAEDYCADLGLTRTPERTELLYPRSKLVTTAKAFGLQAIDLVCVNYKDQESLRAESEEGHRLGFDGKQAIHPNQIETIHSAFAPNFKDILKAARVVFSFEHHDKLGTGAYELDGAMIDAPVYKQALKVIMKARSAGLIIPEISINDI